MAFFFPFSTLHELNLDWILDKVKTLTENNQEFNDKADYAVQTADEAKAIAEQAAQATIPDGSITTAKLADYAVTQVKLATNAVGNYQLQDSSVTNSKIYDEAVTTVKLADDAVTTAKIIDDAVTTAKIPDSAVTTAKINNKAVTIAKTGFIWSGSVTDITANSTDNLADLGIVELAGNHLIFLQTSLSNTDGGSLYMVRWLNATDYYLTVIYEGTNASAPRVSAGTGILTLNSSTSPRNVGYMSFRLN